MARFERSANSARGFTLIETVVALLIVSLGMTALYMQLGSNASNALYLRDKTLASWIASNVLTELSLASAWPEIGEEEGEVEFARQSWWFRIEIEETDVENLRRAEVSVAPADEPERIIHTLAALIEPPTPPGMAPVGWDNAPGPRRGRGQGSGPGPGPGPRN